MCDCSRISQVLHIFPSKICEGGRAVGGFRCAKPCRTGLAVVEAEISLMVSGSGSRNARNTQILHIHPEMRRSCMRRVAGGRGITSRIDSTFNSEDDLIGFNFHRHAEVNLLPTVSPVPQINRSVDCVYFIPDIIIFARG